VREKIVRKLRSVRIDFGGERHTGWLPDGAATPPQSPTDTVLLDLEIVQLGPVDYLLQWRPASGELLAGPPCQGDTWHRSLQDALHQAELDFGITPDRWR